MKKDLLKPMLLFTFSTAVLFFACKKEKAGSTDNESAGQLSAAQAFADNIYDDVFEVAFDAADDAGINARTTQQSQQAVRFTIPACAVISVTPTTQNVFPKTIVVDFGTGCTNASGITRKGKITFVFTGKLRTTGTAVSAAFENYSVNNYKVEGTYSIINSSTGNGISFTTQINNGKITFPDAGFYNYSGTKILSQTAGQGTANLSDDEFRITGSCSFGSSNGNSLTSTITTPLLIKFSCKWIVAGVIKYTYNNLNLELNYGNGECDNRATLKLFDQTKEIVLPR